MRLIRVLLVDDIRTMDMVAGRLWTDRSSHHILFRTCRTYQEGLSALKNEGPWDVLFLDHDLADQGKPEKTGYSILCYLEENLGLLPKKIEVVSSNPVGRAKMNMLIRRLHEMKEDKNV